MWKSKMFTEHQMVAWENKTAAPQTLATLQTYFTNKWLERKQYSATMTKQSRFKEGALLAQETKAAEEEGESQALLFAMLQEQHDKQITAMTAANKANMDVMMERMNALVAGNGGNKKTTTNKQPGKESITPANANQPKKPTRAKHTCIHCKAQVLHKPDNCPELKANKDKWWKGWTLVNDKA